MLLVIIHKPDKKTGMLTRLSDNALKLEYHAGLKNWADELWKAATTNVALHSVLTQKSDINFND